MRLCFWVGIGLAFFVVRCFVGAVLVWLRVVVAGVGCVQILIFCAAFCRNGLRGFLEIRAVVFVHPALAMATKRSPLVAFFHARLEYLGCVHTGPKDTMPEKLKTESAASMLKQLAFARAISLQDAIDLTKMLNDSNLPDDVAAPVRQAIQDKADIAGEAAHVQQNAVKQTNLYIENYQTAEDWECYGSSNSHNTKLLRMVSRMHSIFLYHPTEPTIAGAVAVALHSDGQHDAAYLLQQVRMTKEMLQAIVGKESARPAIYPDKYPADVQQFKEANSTIYASAFALSGPTACPVTAVVLQVLKSSTPCRISKTGCTDMHVGPASKATARSQQLVQSMLTRQPPQFGLPGFQWCDRAFVGAQQSAQHLGYLPPPPVFAAPRAASGILALADRLDSDAKGSQPQAGSDAGEKSPLEEKKDWSQVPQPATSGGALAGSSPPAVSEMVARFQQQALAAKKAAQRDGDEGKDGAKTKKAMKRPAAATVQSKSGPSAKKKKKSKAHTKAKKTAKKVHQKSVHVATMSALPFRKGAHGPRYYGSVTVYTDSVNNLWRVKPGPGERVHKMFHMKATEAESRKQWATVFAYVKSLKQT